MPPEFTICPERRFVRLVYRGVATYAEWASVMDSIIAHPDFQPGFAFLIDRRAVPPPTAAFVDRAVDYIARHANQLGGDFQSATVVADKVSYGMARMVQGLSGSEHMRIFTTVADAEKWLEGTTSETIGSGDRRSS
jgi:hypothetical protein